MKKPAGIAPAGFVLIENARLLRGFLQRAARFFQLGFLTGNRLLAGTDFFFQRFYFFLRHEWLLFVFKTRGRIRLSH